MEIDRRGFLKGSLVSGVLGCVPLVFGRSSGNKVETVREDKLREEVGHLMNSANMGVMYYRRVGNECGAFNCEDGEFISYNSGEAVGRDIPIRHLEKVRGMLYES